MTTPLTLKLKALVGAVAIAIAVGIPAAAMAYNGQDDKEPAGNAPAEDARAADPVWDVVMSDLENRFGISNEDIDELKLEDATWNDASLGNPQPGETYQQVITPGYVFTIEADGKTYVYHTDLTSSIELVTIDE